MDEIELLRRTEADAGVPDERVRDFVRHELKKMYALEPARLNELHTRIHPRRRLVTGFAVVALATAGIVLSIPALSIGGGLFNLFGTLSHGRDVAKQSLSVEDRWILHRGGAFGWKSMRFLGAGGPIAYYAITKDDGSTCFATGASARRPHISGLDCQAANLRSRFPSRNAPLLDHSAYGLRTQHKRWIFRLTGLAADGIGRVGVVTEAGRTDTVPVSHNVYYMTDLPAGPLRAIVAFDKAGRRVATIPLRGPVRALGEAGSVLVDFMTARINRDNTTMESLMTDQLRASLGQLQVPTYQLSNPCWYRYELLPPSSQSARAIEEKVRIFEHWWPGDVGGGPPQSFVQTVGLTNTDGAWRVDQLGPAEDVREELNEPHGPTKSACGLSQG